MRWIHFVATSTLFGSALFWTYAGPAVIASRLRPTLGWSVWIIRCAAAVAAVSGFAWLVATIANVTGGWANTIDPEMLHIFMFETPFGGPALLRIAMFGVLLVIAGAPLPPRVRIGASIVTGAVLLVSQAWLGHAVEGGATVYGACMIASYAVHVLAAGAWAGGLPILAFALGTTRSVRRGVLSLDLLKRFSCLAVVAVCAIGLSGTANTLFHLDGHVTSLVRSAYGAVLLAKVALVAAMLVFAAINRFGLMPRGRQACGRPFTVDVARLKTNIVLETVLAILVMGAAALLGITPPPR